MDVYFKRTVQNPDGGDAKAIKVKRSYISVENLNNIIHIPPSEFKIYDSIEFRLMLRNIQAEQSMSTIKNIDYKDYDLTERVLIQVSSSLLKLKDQIPVSDVIQSGLFKYYHFTKFKSETSLILLNVMDSGEADLYIGKDGKYPTLDEYYLKSDSFKNDQI